MVEIGNTNGGFTDAFGQVQKRLTEIVPSVVIINYESAR